MKSVVLDTLNPEPFESFIPAATKKRQLRVIGASICIIGVAVIAAVLIERERTKQDGLPPSRNVPNND